MLFDKIAMRAILFLQVLLLTLCFRTDARAVINGETEQTLKNSINTLYKARNSAVSRYKEQEKIELISQTDRKDFTLFISYLDGRIIHYCRELYNNSGATGLLDTPCPKSFSENDATEYNEIAELSEATDNEKIGQLNEQFENSLNQFDDMLLREQEKIAKTVPRQRESTGTDPGTQSGGRSGSFQHGATGGNSDTIEKESGPEVHSKNKTLGTGKNRLPETNGRKDLSENDDDIIAKQLREAAEQETDPEIKEKLWEEYRKYKESRNGGTSWHPPANNLKTKPGMMI